MNCSPTSAARGLFTKELDEAMLDGRIDIAVHSMKDMPSLLPEGIAAHAVMPREDPREAFISNTSKDMAGLPAGARVGTASLRRSAQVRRARPDLSVVPLRGNVDTRLRKLDTGEVDATFLAVAGLRRLGKEAVITQAVPVHDMLPAVGQGALCATCRTGDLQAGTLLETLAEAEVTSCVMAERAMLAALNGSCRTPIAGHAVIGPSGELTLKGMIACPDGSEMVADEAAGPAAEAGGIGAGLARTLLAGASPALVKAITESRERAAAAHPPYGARTVLAMRVLVTRPREDAAGLAEALTALGCEAVLEPLFHVEFMGYGGAGYVRCARPAADQRQWGPGIGPPGCLQGAAGLRRRRRDCVGGRGGGVRAGAFGGRRGRPIGRAGHGPDAP